MIREPSYRIRLVDCGPDKVKVIKFLHNELHFGLLEAARAVENLPLYIKTETRPMSCAQAREMILPIVEGLRERGAVVEWDFDYGDYE